MESRDRELLMRFIQQESNIKERWQIVELFEEERHRFEEERKMLISECDKLNKEYTEKMTLVSELREQVERLEQSFRELERKEQESKERFMKRETHAQELHKESKELEEKLIAQREEFKTLSLKVESLKVEHIVRQNAIKVIKEKRDALLESAALSSLHEVTPLRQVEVMGKGGKIIKATPAKNYYAHSVISVQSERTEQELMEELEKLQAKNIDLEIENGNMNMEIRELKNELQAFNHLLSQRKPIPQTPRPVPTEQHQTQPTATKSTHPIEAKISALGQAVEPTNFKENTDSGTFEALLEEEPFHPLPQSHSQAKLVEEEIIEVVTDEVPQMPETPSLSPVKQAQEQQVPPQVPSPAPRQNFQEKQEDLQEDKVNVYLKDPDKTSKGNPFLNENVRIITPQGFKTPDEVL